MGTATSTCCGVLHPTLATPSSRLSTLRLASTRLADFGSIKRGLSWPKTGGLSSAEQKLTSRSRTPTQHLRHSEALLLRKGDYEESLL